MGAYFTRVGQGKASGFTIIEVMMFFAVTGLLMLGVLGSASVGVNSQRYNDAVNTFSAILQQEFTNTTNVINTKSVEGMCGGSGEIERPRGISNCSIIGRLMTVDSEGNIVRSNIVGTDPGNTNDTNTELQVVQSYLPQIDVASQERDVMSWGTNLERGSPASPSFASVLIIRSPRSGNVYSYVVHSTSEVIASDQRLREEIGTLATTTPAPNSRDQFFCIDRGGWVATPARAIKLAPYTSGPSGVSAVEVEGSTCAS